MKEKLETLSLVQLKELCKAQGLKVSGLRKAQLIELLCDIADKEPELKPREKVQTAQRQPQQSQSQQAKPAYQEHQPAQSIQPSVAEPHRYGYESPMQTMPQAQHESYYSTGLQQPQAQQQAQAQMQQGMPQLPNYQQYQAFIAQMQQQMQQAQQQAQAQAQPQPSAYKASGILEIMPDGFGFIRGDNYLPSDNDVYVAPGQIRKFNLRTGDIISGSCRLKSSTERFAALIFIDTINGIPTDKLQKRRSFETMTPIFPNKRIKLEMPGRQYLPLRVLDLLSPLGKGQRGMIVSPPKAGKTTLLKQVAKSVIKDPSTHLIILLIDERPEEVTDIKEEVTGDNVEVIFSTFDELPERHKRVSEMTIERAKRLVEDGKDVVILLDSITRLSRAYNQIIPASGKTLSGGLDPGALHMPKRFFGAARNMREGGSLTILATALIDTGSRMDDVIYEEFKGTGNMEVVLDRKLSEKRIFPAIDILKSGTRRDDLLLSQEEQNAVTLIRRAFSSMKQEEAVEKVLDLFCQTKDNADFIQYVEKVLPH